MTTRSTAKCWPAGSNGRGTRSLKPSMACYALDMLSAEHFDLVLLDILMPGMNGLEVLRRLKADDRLRHLPVIMISALTDIDNVAQCLQIGADDYLPRPYNATILRARVDALLEAQAAAGPRDRILAADRTRQGTGQRATARDFAGRGSAGIAGIGRSSPSAA